MVGRRRECSGTEVGLLDPNQDYLGGFYIGLSGHGGLEWAVPLPPVLQSEVAETETATTDTAADDED